MDLGVSETPRLVTTRDLTRFQSRQMAVVGAARVGNKNDPRSPDTASTTTTTASEKEGVARTAG